uniref:FZ domain-containing protein n=1 Tax=Hanusia phi TaxID=3032 RepID=A0A7S0DZF9_9CRYP|mmetsp:Transcript_11835/g.27272  ORF Transcript_11835/g.27272 Transcript_11835/m.27272 type:complete len:181 (+) Transcript_11835:533-1075(+)
MARSAVEVVMAKPSARNKYCQMAMKAYVCTLYFRPCNSTGGLVRPICLEDCLNAYRACGYPKGWRDLQCGEEIKAGWVTFQGDTRYPPDEKGDDLWNTGMPSCERAMLRSDLSLRDALLQHQTWTDQIVNNFNKIFGKNSRQALNGKVVVQLDSAHRCQQSLWLPMIVLYVVSMYVNLVG